MRPFQVALFALTATSGCAAAPPPPSAVPTSAAIEASADGTSAANKISRQIIYRASLLLYVTDFGAADQQIQKLTKDAGGYIAQFREDRPSGSIRGGKWTARVPQEKFDAFLDAVCSLGIAGHREVQSDDVTEEYVDINARLKNKQALESRLLELVAKRTDAIHDVVALENELARVREEIERMQGRLRYLTDRVALTTVEIAAYERIDYCPPQATLAGKIAHTFFASLDGLRECAEALLLCLVALLPWAFTFAVLCIPLVLAIRRRMTRACKPVIPASSA